MITRNSTHIKVGDEVAYSNWTTGRRTATITDIQLCEPGEKYGEGVDRVEMKDLERCTFGLSDGTWCYGEQVILS